MALDGPNTIFFSKTHSEGIKIIPKINKNSRVIPEMAGKVRLAIKRQELARNMIKIWKINPKNNIF